MTHHDCRLSGDAQDRAVIQTAAASDLQFRGRIASVNDLKESSVREKLENTITDLCFNHEYCVLEWMCVSEVDLLEKTVCLESDAAAAPQAFLMMYGDYTLNLRLWVFVSLCTSYL